MVARAAERAFGADGASLLSDNGWTTVSQRLLDDPQLLTRREVVAVPAASAIDAAVKGGTADPALTPGASSRCDSPARSTLASTHRSSARQRAPTPATVGIWGALAGSLLTMAVTLIVAVPVGVLSAVYLEEFAPSTWWTDLIEVSINNLAAIPSIIFGLLGLAVFLAVFDLPRAAPIVGGLTLALMTMPVIVIAARNAIKGVPPSGARRPRSVWAPVRCRWCSTMSCRLRCPAS